MELKGKLIEIFETNQISDSFKKREFVIEYADNPQFPQLLKFEMVQENCQLLDDFNKGDDVEVLFNLRGRKWTDPQGVDKYFNTLQSWRIQKIAQEAAPAGSQEMPPGPEKEPEWLKPGDKGDDDLPF